MTTQLHRNLVYNLKRRRAFLAISQMELAEKAGLSSSYIGEIEMGHRYPSAAAVERLAAALGVKPYRLFMGEEDVADIGGSEAVYEAADLLKETILQGLDSAVRSLAPQGGGGGTGLMKVKTGDGSEASAANPTGSDSSTVKGAEAKGGHRSKPLLSQRSRRSKG